MKKKLSKMSFDSLKDSFPLISKEEMLQMIGGSTCVIYCFSFVADISYEWYVDTASQQGYLASGGVSYDDMSAVGLIGGLNVSAIGESEYKFNYNNSTQTTITNQKIMMTFNHSNGEDHAVIVTTIDETGAFHYYDPSTGQNGVRAAGSFTALYAVGRI